MSHIFYACTPVPVCVCLCAVKLNGGRTVTGILRGFDPYMNIVMDDTIEERSSTQKYKIGMVVGGVCVGVWVCGCVCVCVCVCPSLLGILGQHLY